MYHNLDLCAPIPILLQVRLDTRSHPFLLRLQRPWSIDVTRWHVCVGECLSIFQAGETRIIVVVSILLGVMSPHPSANLEETNIDILGLFLDSINVSRVQLLSIQKASLLKNGNSFEPFG